MSSDKPRPDSLLVPLPRTIVPRFDNPVEQARAELKAALAAIEEKANVPRRLQQASDRAVAKARAFTQRNPSAATVVVVGVAVVVGVVVWGAVRAYTAPRH
jgi:hypothetical protein